MKMGKRKSKKTDCEGCKSKYGVPTEGQGQVVYSQPMPTQVSQQYQQQYQQQMSYMAYVERARMMHR